MCGWYRALQMCQNTRPRVCGVGEVKVERKSHQIVASEGKWPARGLSRVGKISTRGHRKENLCTRPMGRPPWVINVQNRMGSKSMGLAVYKGPGGKNLS